MMFYKKAVIYKMKSTINQGISEEVREDIKTIRCSDIQGLNKTEAEKIYGIKDIKAQVFTSFFTTEDLFNVSYLELDNRHYFVKEVYNYPPSHSILLLKEVI